MKNVVTQLLLIAGVLGLATSGFAEHSRVVFIPLEGHEIKTYYSGETNLEAHFKVKPCHEYVQLLRDERDDWDTYHTIISLGLLVRESASCASSNEAASTISVLTNIYLPSSVTYPPYYPPVGEPLPIIRDDSTSAIINCHGHPDGTIAPLPLPAYHDWEYKIVSIEFGY